MHLSSGPIYAPEIWILLDVIRSPSTRKTAGILGKFRTSPPSSGPYGPGHAATRERPRSAWSAANVVLELVITQVVARCHQYHPSASSWAHAPHGYVDWIYPSPHLICVAGLVCQSLPADAILSAGRAWGMPYAPELGLVA